jgi:hypothetical protein
MEYSYQKLFRSLPDLPFPKGLNERIMRQIALLERRVIIVRRSSFALAAALFIAAFIPSALSLASEFSQSGFLSYASLMISDGDIALSHLSEFVLSLVESLPLATITLVLALIFLFFGALEIISEKTRSAVETLSERFA